MVYWASILFALVLHYQGGDTEIPTYVVDQLESILHIMADDRELRLSS